MKVCLFQDRQVRLSRLDLHFVVRNYLIALEAIELVLCVDAGI